ncbi:MAG: alpha-2-macroglobulin family protein, partial [Planctomycetota bacterium]|nr:alpha-2-macroglobulin family protein [Planctomycetota bacterium]
AWAMGQGTRVGQSTVEVVTTKKLLLRLQAPRFFVEKDEVVLSANIHNYLKVGKEVTAKLELEGPFQIMGNAVAKVTIDSMGEKRIDWRVKVTGEGEAVVRMKALTDVESDAMEMRFPVYVHGMTKVVSFSGHMRPENKKALLKFKVPAERRVKETSLEVRYSPTLAGAMVDALPYLVEYPYGCTEQTLNRFLPTVITQKILMDMNLDLKDIEKKRTNLNAQEIGDDKARAKNWKKYKQYKAWSQNPVFSKSRVKDMVKQGVKRLTNMQLSDGGWGWFSGYGEHSYPHTTAYTVHGLQVARMNDVAIVPGTIKKGVAWLRNYQNRQVMLLDNAPSETKPYKTSASNLDAFVFMVLNDGKVTNQKMLDYLYRDRNKLSVYAKAMFGMALHKVGDKEKLAMIIKNIEQYLVMDKENQTAYLNLQNGGYWWYWYGSEYEAHAYYLKLLAKTDPKSDKASWLVKYLLNNRKNGSYWKSTRDTALVIEALADYMKASGEDEPDMTLEVLLDGKKVKEVKISKANLFSFDNKLLLTGDAIGTGEHTVEFRKKGKGPLYFNAYLSYFSKEDFITKAGLEVKVQRKYYKLVKVEKKVKVAGARGQVVEQKVEKYKREEIKNLATIKSGDLVEIELEIDSKNDYEYLIFEDMKAAGFEPFKVRSGYIREGLTAYMELRDEKVCFFVQNLARGKHSVSYRMRAEIPGKFSALPTRAYAMYAPEIKANSDEIKVIITD